MNLCVVETKKKQKSKSGKNKGQVRTIVHEEPKQSFFHYFSEPIEVPRCSFLALEAQCNSDACRSPFISSIFISTALHDMTYAQNLVLF